MQKSIVVCKQPTHEVKHIVDACKQYHSAGETYR